MKASHHDISANIGDGVSIRLPRLRFEIERRQAERLRDVLNTVLPKPVDPLHDPRVSDRDVLSAAASLAHEAGYPTAAAQLQPVIGATMQGTGNRQGGQPQPSVARRLHLLSIAGDVEPELSEPFATDKERVEAAQDYRRAHGDEDGLYRVDVTGDPDADVLIEAFGGRELERTRSCTLCRCEATGEVYGLPVCDYHHDHTEDEPRCPNCAGKYTCERCGNRHAEHVYRDVALCDRCNNVVQSVAIGDRVRDPLDGTWREIVGIDGLADGGTCHMADGGNMSLDECAAAEKRLPSEGLPS